MAGIIMNENCDLKDYMKKKVIKDVRDILKERTFLLPFEGNYKNDKKYGEGLCLMLSKHSNMFWMFAEGTVI